ncbi:hypothetical protein DNTS_020387, partial [Danionella cerebrum]
FSGLGVCTELTGVFLKDILDVYGENGSLNRNDVHTLLKTIVQRTLDPNIAVHAQCVSSEQILEHYGLENVSRLSEDHLVRVCPALLNQAVLPPCPSDTPTVTDPIGLHVWGYGFLAVTIINLASLLGLILVPVTSKPFFPKVLSYFIGLAVGTLFSNAALQLIPEAFGFDPKADGYIMQAIGIFGGFYALYLTEKILRIVLKPGHEHGHSHFQSSESVQQNGISTISNSEKISISSETPTQQGCCLWLRGRRLSKVKTVAWMISLSDALHNFIDGMAIGASFTLSILSGFSTSIAIVCEEFPHELGQKVFKTFKSSRNNILNPIVFR